MCGTYVRRTDDGNRVCPSAAESYGRKISASSIVTCLRSRKSCLGSRGDFWLRRHNLRDSDGVRQPDGRSRQTRDFSSTVNGTGLAMLLGMTNDPVSALLADLHHSLDRLADDLSRDRPGLAVALRKEAAWIPRPESRRRHPSGRLARRHLAQRSARSSTALSTKDWCRCHDSTRSWCVVPAPPEFCAAVQTALAAPGPPAAPAAPVPPVPPGDERAATLVGDRRRTRSRRARPSARRLARSSTAPADRRADT